MFNKYKSTSFSKEAKVVFENFVSLFVLQIVGIILPLITLPYVLRIIGFDRYGIIVMSTSLITYFQSLTDFSFRITGTRDVAIFRDSPVKINVIFSKILTIKVLFLFFSLVCISLIVFFIPSFHTYSVIYIFSSLMLIGYAIFPEWFFQGIEKMKYITFINLFVKIIFTFSVFFLIKKKDDYWIYPLVQSLGYIVAGLIGLFIVFIKYRVKFIFLPFRSIIKGIKQNIPIFINQFVPNLYNNTTIFVLGLLTNSLLLGVYNAILTVVNLLVTFLDIVSRVFFPYLNRRKDKFTLYAKLAVMLAILLVSLTLIFNKLIFWYLNLSFQNSFFVLLILSIGVLGYSLYNIFGVNYFIVNRQDKKVMVNTIFSSIVGLILVYPLIKYYGIIGAAINLSLCRWLMGGGLTYQYFKGKGSNLTKNRD